MEKTTGVYTLQFSPFSVAQFDALSYTILKEFFLYGVIVNGKSYSIDETGELEIDGKFHYPMEFDDVIMMELFYQIFRGTGDMFPIDERVKIMRKLSDQLRRMGPLPVERVKIVTTNDQKFASISQEVAEFVPIVPVQSRPLTEIQGTVEEIVQNKLRAQTLSTHSITVAEDTAVCFSAMGGAPGPYVKDFLRDNDMKSIDHIVTTMNDDAVVVNTAFSVYYFDSIGLMKITLVCKARCRWRYIEGATTLNQCLLWKGQPLSSLASYPFHRIGLYWIYVEIRRQLLLDKEKWGEDTRSGHNRKARGF